LNFSDHLNSGFSTFIGLETFSIRIRDATREPGLQRSFSVQFLPQAIAKQDESGFVFDHSSGLDEREDD
jgi:hypothetical protein